MTFTPRCLSRMLLNMFRHRRIRALGTLACCLLGGGLALGGDAHAAKRQSPALEGFWDTPAGRLEIKLRGERAGGVLRSALEGVNIDTPRLVLDGTYFEDNLTAEIHLGVVAPGCGDTDKKAFVLLLLTRSGKLTGGVSSKEPCAAEVSSVTFHRSADQAQGPAVRRSAETAPSPADVDQALQEAFALVQAGRFEAARKLFVAVTKKAPARGEAFNGVGVTHAMRNEWRDAIDWYKLGLEAQPGFSDLYYNLACAYAQLGNGRMALRYLKLSASKGWADLAVMEADPDLNPLRDMEGYAEIRSLMEMPPPPVP